MNARVLLDTIAALAIFTFVSSAIFVLGTHHIHMYRLPTIQWWQYVFYYGYRRDLDRWLLIGAAAGAIPSATLLLRTAWELWARHFFLLWRESDPVRTIERGASDNHGRADYMPMDEAKRMWPAEPDQELGGVVVGEAERVDLGPVRNIPFDPENTDTWGNGGLAPLLIDPCRRGSTHSIVIGGSGVFKSLALVTSLLTWKKSFFCLDPTEELADLVAKELKHRGKKVALLTIGEEGPNVLDGIDITDTLAETRARSIAGRIVGPIQEDDKNARFKKWGRTIILAMLADMLWDPDTPAEYKTLRSLRYGLDVGTERVRVRLRGIAESSQSQLARSLAGSMWDMVPETFSGALGNATDDTEWLASSSYADLVSGRAYGMADLVEGNLCVFCQVPQQALEHTPGVARVLTGCHLDAVFAAKGNVNGRVYFPIDEAVFLGKDPALKVARDQGRKSKITLQLFFQSEFQIEEVWGRPGRMAWFDALSWRTYAAVQNLDTARDVSATLGTFGARAYSQGKNSGKSARMMEPGTRSSGSNTNEHEISRELAKVHELMQNMRDDERITIVRNRKPVRHGAAIGFRRPEIVGLLGKSRYRPEEETTWKTPKLNSQGSMSGSESKNAGPVSSKSEDKQSKPTVLA